MKSRILLLLAALLTIVSAWLPWAVIFGVVANGFNGPSGRAGWIFVTFGVLIAIMAFFDKRWTAFIAILLSLCVTAFGIKYYYDGSSLDILGYGIYVMLAGGIIGIIGGIFGLIKKKMPVIV